MNTLPDDSEPKTLLIGCCGAYCGTCRVLREGACRGCRTGYGTGGRDIRKAKCPMKVCCITTMGDSGICAGCPEYVECGTLRAFHEKKGYKYTKYRQASDFIRTYGVRSFLEHAERWTNAYGQLSDLPTDSHTLD
jgi:hypothetical protein